MSNDPISSDNEKPRRQRIDPSMLYLPPDMGNATEEELTWPIVTPKNLHNFVFYEGPPDMGNATEEELTWSIAPFGELIPNSLADPDQPVFKVK